MTEQPERYAAIWPHSVPPRSTPSAEPRRPDRSAQDRRRRAPEYDVSQERFCTYRKRVVIEQVAEEVLERCQRAAVPARSNDAQPELAGEIQLEGRCAAARLLVTVHVEPVELLRGVDVVVAAANVYLEIPQSHKASVAAALRRAAARRGPDDVIMTDEVADELRSWVSHHTRGGMPVAAGSAAVTSAGVLDEQDIRRADIAHKTYQTGQAGTPVQAGETRRMVRRVTADAGEPPGTSRSRSRLRPGTGDCRAPPRPLPACRFSPACGLVDFCPQHGAK